MAALAPAYTPRRPTETALYGVVRDHLETFLGWARDTYEKPIPRYVENELRAHVLSLPFALRPLAAFDASVLGALARIFAGAIEARYRGRTRSTAFGAVTFVQRFGGSLNLNVHFHVVVLDGVYTRDDQQRVAFSAAQAPSRLELDTIVRRVQDRSLAWLRRRGRRDERPLEERSNEAQAEGAMDACAAIALQRGSRWSATGSTCTLGGRSRVREVRRPPSRARVRDGPRARARHSRAAGDRRGRAARGAGTRPNG